jgi:RNA polymerase sigma factor for flagellar operon FliA
MMRRKQKTKDQLWDEFYSGNDHVYQDLVEAYYPLVASIAKMLKKGLPAHVDIDDLVSDGSIGLMEAIRRFDRSVGYKFETYASLRIRGAIIDGLRAADWAPRSLRIKWRDIDKAIEILAQREGAWPKDSEVDDFLGWDDGSVDRIKSRYITTIFSDINERPYVGGEESSLATEELIEDINTPVDELDYEHVIDRIVRVIGTLDESDSSILALFYVYELSLTEVAELLGLTEARVSQMRSAALGALKTRLSL